MNTEKKKSKAQHANKKKAHKLKQKKNAQLVIRLNEELRQQFVTACQDTDTSAAREIRRFMKQYIERYERGELD